MERQESETVGHLMQQLSISAGPAATLLVVGNPDNPVPHLIQNIDLYNTVFLGDTISIDINNPRICAPLYPGQTTVASGDTNVFAIASTGQNVSVNVYRGVMSFFQPLRQLILSGATTGLFIYSPTPGPGNLIGSWSSTAGVDQYGNPYGQGISLFATSDQTVNVFTINDANGNALLNMDSAGNMSAQTIAVGNDLVIGGQSLQSWMNSQPIGIIARGWTPNGPWPSTPIGTSEIAILELDQTLQAGRQYKLQLMPAQVTMPTTPTGNWWIHRIRSTNDGSTPTTASPLLTPTSTPFFYYNAVGGTLVTQFQEYIVGNISTTALYRFLVCAWVHSGTAQYAEPLEFRIEDCGGYGYTNMNNNGLAIGSGTSGGTSLRNYTEYFYPVHNWTYDNNGGTITGPSGGDANSIFQGDNGNGNSRFAYIQWGVGSLGHNLNTILNTYQINAVYFRLTNQGSSWGSGCSVGWHSSTVLGGGQGTYSAILNSGGTWYAKGAEWVYTLTAAQWAPFKAAGVTYFVLAPDPANLHNKGWYGWFNGMSGGTAYGPRLQVNYTAAA